MKIPKHIQLIAAGVVAAGLLYLGYSEYVKMSARIKTIENNLEIMHDNLKRVNSTNVQNVVSNPSTKTSTSKVNFKNPVVTNMTAGVEILEPETIRVKKDEIEKLEEQLENYDSNDELSDSYLSDDGEYTISSDELEDDVVETTNLTPESEALLNETLNELTDEESKTHQLNIVEETGDFSDIVVDNGNVVDLSTTTETTTVQTESSNVDVLKDLLNYNGTELQEKLQKNTCVELRNVLKQCNLSTVGKKQVLINKLVNHITHQNKFENEVATN